jgi:hypothetical protein
LKIPNSKASIKSYSNYVDPFWIKFCAELGQDPQQVHDILQQTWAKYEGLHNQHHGDPHFQVGDQVWLHLDKQRFKNQQRHKLEPNKYGPYTSIQQMRPNAFKLDDATSAWHS